MIFLNRKKIFKEIRRVRQLEKNKLLINFTNNLTKEETFLLLNQEN